MKILAALAVAAFAFALPAKAQESDPKLDFLGLCIAQGSSSSYCACIADTLEPALPGKDFIVYNDYLTLVSKGEQDPAALIDALTTKHGISKKDLARILTAANAVVGNPETCAGL